MQRKRPPFPPTLQVPGGPLPLPRIPWIPDMRAEWTKSWLGVWDIPILKNHCLSEIGTCLHRNTPVQPPGGAASGQGGASERSGGGARVGRGAGAEERGAVPGAGKG